MHILTTSVSSYLFVVVAGPSLLLVTRLTKPNQITCWAAPDLNCIICCKRFTHWKLNCLINISYNLNVLNNPIQIHYLFKTLPIFRLLWKSRIIIYSAAVCNEKMLYPVSFSVAQCMCSYSPQNPRKHPLLSPDKFEVF